MNKKEICRKLEKVTKKIIMLSGDQVLGTGTGVVIMSNGVLLTANHVVSEFAEVSNPRILIINKDSGGKVEHVEYEPVLGGVSFNINMPDVLSPVHIDLAILQPKSDTNFEYDFIRLEDNLASVGTDVLMAGFPDEIKLPLNIEQHLNFNNPVLSGQEQLLQNTMSLLMIKSGMVGASHNVNLNGKYESHDVAIKGSSYWIDNGATFGASGGAVVNERGRLIGIMCEKAMTSFPPYNTRIPSGSTIVLSHELITWALPIFETPQS